ncbi:MAG: glycosyltransferase family 9 protein [Bdellovibrionales bacterium]
MTKQPKERILILRFSSFGDVTQCLSVPAKLRQKWPDSEIHWAVRDDLAILLNNHPDIQKIWSFPRRAGLLELFRFSWLMRRQKFTRVYDAHNSTRSWVIGLILQFTSSALVLRKSQKRILRFLLFKLRIDLYQKPRSGQRDLIEPLKAWGISDTLPPPPQLFLLSDEIESVRKKLPTNQFIALAASAAFELKRWPRDYWVELIHALPQEKFILLGGPEDFFLEEIRKTAPDRVYNWAGKTNLRETSAVVKLSKILISNDTGILHTAEQLGHPSIALMGPAPFGFPSRPLTSILELDLPCRPCSKHGQGPCINANYHQCLKGLSPQLVLKTLKSREVIS